jgi:hypothetical protein
MQGDGKIRKRGKEMTIDTKYSIGDLLSWRIGGKVLLVCGLKIYAEKGVEYICSYANSDGLPTEGTFKECEVEPWSNKQIGFTK